MFVPALTVMLYSLSVILSIPVYILKYKINNYTEHEITQMTREGMCNTYVIYNMYILYSAMVYNANKNAMQLTEYIQ